MHQPKPGGLELQRHLAYRGSLVPGDYGCRLRHDVGSPRLTPVLPRREVFEAGSGLLVEEIRRVDQPPLAGLAAAEPALDPHLRGVQKERLGQKLLPREGVVRALVERYWNT